LINLWLTATAHTRIHRTRLPIATWERAVELILGHPETSACSLQRSLGLGSYRTAWRMARIVREALQAVEWPLLTGEVEFCDVNLASRKHAPRCIWLAIERRTSASGLVRAWRDEGNFHDGLRRLASALEFGATVITTPFAGFRELKSLGFRQRSEPLGAADTLPAATATATAFRRMLQARGHHGYAAATIETYLDEFVFRHNAAVLGWSPANQRRRVMTLLKAPSLSA
jgi:hypothetical protein